MEKEKDRPAESLFYHLLELENKAITQLQEAETTLLMRYNMASDPNSDDNSVEEFSRWLKTGRQNIEQARNNLAKITMERGLIRQALILIDQEGE